MASDVIATRAYVGGYEILWYIKSASMIKYIQKAMGIRTIIGSEAKLSLFYLPH
jgi:hypothetical protein